MSEWFICGFTRNACLLELTAAGMWKQGKHELNRDGCVRKLLVNDGGCLEYRMSLSDQ